MQNLSRGGAVTIYAIAISQLKRTDFESHTLLMRVGSGRDPYRLSKFQMIANAAISSMARTV